MKLKIYNTLTRKVEEFIPLEENVLKMYSCGVTTYDEIHLGHARQAIVFDVIRNYFEYSGYKVEYVRNHTDIDDKIIKRANENNKKWDEVSNYYIRETEKDLERLKVRPATHEPKVTDHIDDIIKFISELIEKGYAYESNGDVLFNIAKDKEYGKLSNRKIDELISEKETPGKINPQDFSLWKKAKEGEPFWESPWGKGRPGWHIECSVMAKVYLGESIDIHGGGIDLLFPHHENEIAQSECCNGKIFSRYWVHNGLVAINHQKMSKSLGNFLTVKDALVKQTTEEVRYLVLIQNYASQIDFSEELFIEARKRLYYFYKTLAAISKYKNETPIDKEKCPEIIKEMEADFIASMNDNLNTAKVISILSSVFSRLNELLEDKSIDNIKKKGIFAYFYQEFEKITKVLRLFDEDPQEYLKKLQKKVFEENNISEEKVEELISERQKARNAKDYKTSDKIRNNLMKMKINIRDNSEGNVSWDLIFD